MESNNTDNTDNEKLTKFFTHECAELSYTFTLNEDPSDLDNSELIIEAVKKDDYAIWKSTIKTMHPDAYTITESLANSNSIFINFPANVKYQIILDYIMNKLDDTHKVIFPTDCQDETMIEIKIIINPKYGRETTIVIPIYNEIISPIEKLEKNMHNMKVSTNMALSDMTSKYCSLELKMGNINEKMMEIMETLAKMETKFGKIIIPESN